MKGRLIEHMFYNYKYKEKAVSIQVGGTEKWSSQNSHPWHGDPQVGRISQSWRHLMRAGGSEPNIRLLSLGHLHWEDKPP